MDVAFLHELDPDRMRSAVISKGGQITIPAEIRRRWGTDELELADLGDRIVVSPAPTDPLARVRGSLPLPDGVTSESLRAAARAEDAEGQR